MWSSASLLHVDKTIDLFIYTIEGKDGWYFFNFRKLSLDVNNDINPYWVFLSSVDWKDSCDHCSDQTC